jgi:hypothetical protein
MSEVIPFVLVTQERLEAAVEEKRTARGKLDAVKQLLRETAALQDVTFDPDALIEAERDFDSGNWKMRNDPTGDSLTLELLGM